jgi:hypothetical protein
MNDVSTYSCSTRLSSSTPVPVVLTGVAPVRTQISTRAIILDYVVACVILFGLMSSINAYEVDTNVQCWHWRNEPRAVHTNSDGLSAGPRFHTDISCLGIRAGTAMLQDATALGGAHDPPRDVRNCACPSLRLARTLRLLSLHAAFPSIANFLTIHTHHSLSLGEL